MIKTRIQDHSVDRVRPVWSARPAAARLRRARVGPILTRPPIRARLRCAYKQCRINKEIDLQFILENSINEMN